MEWRGASSACRTLQSASLTAPLKGSLNSFIVSLNVLAEISLHFRGGDHEVVEGCVVRGTDFATINF